MWSNLSLINVSEGGYFYVVLDNSRTEFCMHIACPPGVVVGSRVAFCCSDGFARLTTMVA